MTKNEKIYNKVAKEFDTHKYKVEDIFKSQFDFVAKQMSDRTENSILLPRIGTFIFSKRIKNRIEKIKTDDRKND